MKYRRLGKTNYDVSEVSLGAWQIGGSWGTVRDEDAVQVLHTALDSGVNFIDTADVYGDGRSEKLIAQVLADRTEPILVATKAGRRLQPHVADGYNLDNLTAFVDRSLKNLRREALDLVQLHCPPTEVYYRPETFTALEDLKRAGKIRHYGVSVEKVEEAIKALNYPGLATVQIIFNLFRQRPKDLFFGLAIAADVGVIVRLPLSSGLLAGKITRETKFAEDDHRQYNRSGEQFDRGETFSGVDFEPALAAVEQLKQIVPPGISLAGFAMRWILDHPAVSCIIPGARNAAQIQSNVGASDLPSLSPEQKTAAEEVYTRQIRDAVHQRW
ncbi:MAG TPA: aldo/keto reductase [Chthoniobacterales bacterium]